MPTLVHFEIPADDTDRARKFYTGLFSWEFNEIPDMDYWLITTGGEKAAVGGGMMKRQSPGQSITNYIDVSSVDDYAAKIEKLGGKVVLPKTAIPGMGYFLIFTDPENNPLGIWEDNKEAK
jgi:predicted enzyme related to lactoylglutathione lyase